MSDPNGATGVEDADEHAAESAFTLGTRDGLTVVGLGASAGGLDALCRFLERVPADMHAAFIVVTHQQPTGPSLLPQLLARCTAMSVVAVNETTLVKPNTVYVSTPGSMLTLIDGRIEPVSREDAGENARHLPIDYLFRSLAHAEGPYAVGVVLSGTGSDGTLGLKEIKAAGGMVMAQDEISARYPGMPRSAIATLMVDYVLPADELPAQLARYLGERKLRPVGFIDQATPSQELHKVLLFLRSRTGHDFSSYKQSTVRRRVERRMNLRHVDTLEQYVRTLREEPQEADTLFQELLIGVTSFFRDAEAFDCLASEVIDPLFREKSDGDPLRVWVSGCSTGEEAYSVAILLREAAERHQRYPNVQIFATDLDAQAVESARAGIYPESIAADVSPVRLERNFIAQNECYRIRNEVREMCIFAPQNLIGDPPFTKLDLVCCRNLLIYLNGQQQQRIVPMFHYTLRPGGFLFLGTSESLGTGANLFEAVSKRWKIFRRRDVPTGIHGEFTTPGFDFVRDRHVGTGARPAAPNYAHLSERILLQLRVPPSVIVHERGEIVHIHGRTGLFLEPSPGSQTQNNLFSMARDGLQLDLATAIREASTTSEEVVHRGVRVKTNGDYQLVDIRVQRLERPELFRGLFIVTFERTEPVPVEQPVGDLDAEAARRVAELERELQHGKDVHQGVIGELETANEELKSTNEELQSTNEELQSANEELETSKEEMQSLNEELQTVNSELQAKVDELSRTTDDMKNLLNGTDIATIFLDNDLNIKRYTEQAKRVIRLIASDVGRPIGDLTSKLVYDDLIEDAVEVLRTLRSKETEVRSEDGEWYLMRILPYRTTENMIDGLVVTFVAINAVKTLQDETRRFLHALRKSPSTVFAQDAELHYVWAGSPVFGVPPDVVIGKRDEEILPLDAARVLSELKRSVLKSRQVARRQLALHVQGKERIYDVYLVSGWSDGITAGLTGVVTELREPQGVEQQ